MAEPTAAAVTGTQQSRSKSAGEGNAMGHEPRSHAFTPEAATAAAALFVFRAEVEGYWEAICVCGQTCGMTLLPPTKDDTDYVTCPACPRSGRDGGVKWIRVD